MSADDCWNAFVAVLEEGIHMFVPIKLSMYIRKGKPMNNFVRKLMSKKRKCWRARKENYSIITQTNYKDATKALKQVLFAKCLSEENEILTSGNKGLFYSHVRGRMTQKWCYPLKKQINEFGNI